MIGSGTVLKSQKSFAYLIETKVVVEKTCAIVVVAICNFAFEDDSILSLHLIGNTQRNEKFADTYIEYLSLRRKSCKTKLKRKLSFIWHF